MMKDSLFAPALKLAFGASALVAVAAVPASAFAAPAGGAPQVMGDDKYDVKTEQVGDCFVGKECEARIIVTSKGEFHVNDSYPFKFTADATGVEFHGSGGNVFQDKDFAREHTRGTMTLHFKPASKGEVTIAGKFKICICSDKICSPEVVPISFNVHVK